jgi:hypothetical protein
MVGVDLIMARILLYIIANIADENPAALFGHPIECKMRGVDHG